MGHETHFIQGEKVVLYEGESYSRLNQTFSYEYISEDGIKRTTVASDLTELRKAELAILFPYAPNMRYEDIPTLSEAFFSRYGNPTEFFREDTLDETDNREEDSHKYIRISTYVVYTTLLEKPYGSKAIVRISEHDVDMMALKMHMMGYPFERINDVFSHIYDAIHEKVPILMGFNSPISKFLKRIRGKPPDRSYKSIPYLPGNMMDRLLEGARRIEGMKADHLITILLGTGLDSDEAIALRWKDIDIHRRKIYIKSRFYPLLGNPVLMLSTRTRTIPILGDVYKALIALRIHHKRNSISSNTAIDGYRDFIFVDDSGKLFSTDMLQAMLDNAVGEVNLKIYMSQVRDNYEGYEEILRSGADIFFSASPNRTLYPCFDERCIRLTLVRRLVYEGFDCLEIYDICKGFEWNELLALIRDFDDEYLYGFDKRIYPDIPYEEFISDIDRGYYTSEEMRRFHEFVTDEILYTTAAEDPSADTDAGVTDDNNEFISKQFGPDLPTVTIPDYIVRKT